ncbi:MAG: O-antigen polysaccharide polymerase Wzy family protein [Candidatus Sulfotelmatobacter sp.]|nr:O-antigen polysaccharide polymerase Wzy family protein [Candidatus Sulfotelmatobacter sp.]
MIAFYWLLLAILLTSYWLALNHAKRNSVGLTPLLGWLVGVGYFLIVPLVVLTLHGGFKQPAVYDVNGSWDEINLANRIFFRPYLMIWLSLMLTCLVALLSDSNHSQDGVVVTGVIVRRRLERAIVVTIMLSVADWLATIWLQGGLSQFLVSHWYTRNVDLTDRFGGAFIFYTHLSLANQMVFTGAAALYASAGLKERNMRWGFTGLIWLFLVIEMVMSGNRIFLALYLLAFVTSCWLYRRRKIMAALLLVSPAVILIFSLWASIRSNLSQISDSAATQALESDIAEGAVTRVMDVTEGSAAMLLMHMMNDFGTKFAYLHGGTYARLLTAFPPGLYPNRPKNFASVAAELYEPGETTSLGSTALGEAYGNFGFAGILVMPLFTWGATRCRRFFSRAAEPHGLMSAVSFVMFLSFMVFPFDQNVTTGILALLIILALKLEKDPDLPAQGFPRPLTLGEDSV